MMLAVPLVDAQTAEATAGEYTVFVYGSLKRGFHNDRFLQQARYLGDAVTAPHFELLDLGSFPGMISGGNRIGGEVYAVDRKVMRDLDILEGNGSFYERVQIIVSLDGRPVSAWCYMYLLDEGTQAPVVAAVDGTVTWVDS